jgi:hypothetical protein
MPTGSGPVSPPPADEEGIPPATQGLRLAQDGVAARPELRRNLGHRQTLGLQLPQALIPLRRPKVPPFPPHVPPPLARIA